MIGTIEPFQKFIIDPETPFSTHKSGRKDFSETTGRKDSQGLKKAPWHLLPYDALEGIVKVLWYGAGKYSERNWELGMAYSDVFGGVMRHLTSWWNRENTDPETGYSHLWHAGCGILFLITYEIRGVGKDDRP